MCNSATQAVALFCCTKNVQSVICQMIYWDALTKIPDRWKLFKKTNLFGLRIDLRLFNELWGCMPQPDLPSLHVCNVHSNSINNPVFHRNFYSKVGISETLLFSPRLAMWSLDLYSISSQSQTRYICCHFVPSHSQIMLSLVFFQDHFIASQSYTFSF